MYFSHPPKGLVSRSTRYWIPFTLITLWQAGLSFLSVKMPWEQMGGWGVGWEEGSSRGPKRGGGALSLVDSSVSSTVPQTAAPINWHVSGLPKISLFKNQVGKFYLKTLDFRCVWLVSAPLLTSHVTLGMSWKLWVQLPQGYKNTSAQALLGRWKEMMLINSNSCASQRSSSPAGAERVRAVNETGRREWERVCPSESGILAFLCLFMFQNVVRPFHFFE